MTYPCSDCGGYDDCECEEDPDDDQLEWTKEAKRREKQRLEQERYESLEKWEK